MEPSAHAQAPPPTLDAARLALVAGRYEVAESTARELFRLHEHDTDPTAVADLLVEALWRNGRLADARTRAPQATEIRKRLKMPLGPALLNEAEVALLAGEPARAVQRLQSIAAPEGIVLDELALALTAATRNDEAHAVLERLHRQREARPPDERTRARDLEVEGALLQAEGRYASSGPLLDRALSLLERLQPDHPDVARLLGLVGDQRWFEGDLEQAHAAYVRSLTLAQRVLRPGHPALATYLRNLAYATDKRGDVRGAYDLQQRAVAIAERAFGDQHREVAINLNDLANSESKLGEYTGALAHYERALAIAQNDAAGLDPEVATYTYNMALCYVRLGDAGEALRLHNRAIAIWQRLRGPNHPFVGLAWATLGSTFLDFGIPSQALPALQRGLAIQARALGSMHREVATTTKDLAKARLALRDITEADTLSMRAVELWAGTGEEAGRAEAAVVRGDVLVAEGRYEQAAAIYGEALETYDRLFGPANPGSIRIQLQQARAWARLGRTREAFTQALESESAGREHLEVTTRALPERVALSYAAVRPNGLPLALSIAAKMPAAGIDRTRLYDAIIRARAVVLDQMSARRRSLTVVDDGPGDTRDLWEALTDARERFAFLAVAGPAGRPPAQYAALMTQARREKELAERALAARSASFSAELSRNAVGFAQVRTALPQRTGLVSYVRYLGEPEGTPAYVAVVLRADAGVRLIPLGAGTQIDAAVEEWRRRVTTIANTGRLAASAEAAARTAGERLRQLVWDPLAADLQNSARVFVVPDAALNLVNLNALPIDAARYLVEREQTIHYLTAERDLVTAADSGSTRERLLAIGGAAFDMAPPTGAPTGQQQRGADTCFTLNALRFAALGATAQEVRAIGDLWNSGETILTGTNATERAFKAGAPAARVLHLATHGFFLPATCAPQAAGTRSVGGLTAGARRPPAARLVQTINAPLLLSGLAFAGANRRAVARSSDDDGILTAEEVAALNLAGVEWAVLSACDTGRGEIQDGEGVFGLRRAFQVAGVHTVIMSLWSVEDAATRTWMQSLYQARLRGGLDTADAVRRASLDTLQARRASGQSTHPFYWAAFVAAGDWR